MLMAAVSGGEKRRLKPLLREAAPNGRPSAVRRRASTCDFVLSLVRTLQASVPLTFFPRTRRRQRRGRTHVLRLVLSQIFDRQSAPFVPISQTGDSKLTSHVRCWQPSALCLVGHSAGPAGGPCHSRAQR